MSVGKCSYFVKILAHPKFHPNRMVQFRDRSKMHSSRIIPHQKPLDWANWARNGDPTLPRKFLPGETSPTHLGPGRRRTGKLGAIGDERRAPARLRTDESVVQLVLRPVRPRTRSAPLRSAPTECDDLWRNTNQSSVIRQDTNKQSKSI